MIDNCLKRKLQGLKINNMNIYSVYTDTTKKKRDLLLIKQGFSFFASILNFAWALYHKMWLIAALAVIASVIANPAQPTYVVYAMNVSTLLIFGFFASDMREYYANKKGFKLCDIVLAHNEEEAEVRYHMRINHQGTISDL